MEQQLWLVVECEDEDGVAPICDCIRGICSTLPLAEQRLEELIAKYKRDNPVHDDEEEDVAWDDADHRFYIETSHDYFLDKPID